MSTQPTYRRGEKLLKLKNSITSMMNEIDDLLTNGYVDQAFHKMDKFATEVMHMEVYEPGLRYWMTEVEFPIVWASTRDEIKYYHVPNIKEISKEDYYELRSQEWAKLDTTKPLTPPPTN